MRYFYAATLIFCTFVGGMLTDHFKTFPFKYLEPFVTSVEGALATMKMEEAASQSRWSSLPAKGNKSTTATDDSFPPVVSAFGAPVSDKDKGVRLRQTDPLYRGYTLYTTTHDQTARLIDMNGNVIHAWNISFNALWPEQKHLIAPWHMDDSFFYLRDAHVFPDGSLIAVICAGAISPWGAGIVKIDKNGKVEWKDGNFYFSDVSIGIEGNIHTLFQTIRKNAFHDMPNVAPPFLDDSIATFSPDGKIIDRISIFEALYNSDYRAVLAMIHPDSRGDYMHTNSVEEITQDNPAVTWMKKGNIIVSLRNLSAVAVIDPRTKTAVYAGYFPSRYQHDVNLTPQNTLMMFDNLGKAGPFGQSRIAEYDAQTHGLIWSYNGTAERPLDSSVWGAQQVLENGDILITDAQRGHLLQIRRDGTPVWEYYMTERKNGKMPVITSATRYTAADLPFIGK